MSLYIILALVLLLTTAFTGLLGVIKKEFYFPDHSIFLGGSIKQYKGSRAVIWGLIFFFPMSFFSVLVIIGTLKESVNPSSILIYIIAIMIISLTLSILEQKMFRSQHFHQ